jgi:flagellar hook-length control protein FliK
MEQLQSKSQTSERAIAEEPCFGVSGAERSVEVRQAVAPILSTVGTRADMPLHVARQIAEVINRAPGNAIELALHPAELGRVRMTLSPAEVGMTIMIQAERPETLDLMRRNIEALGSAISDLGYEDVSFSFGQETSDSQGENREGQTGPSAILNTNEPAVQKIDPAPVMSQLRLGAAGLDVRI